MCFQKPTVDLDRQYSTSYSSTKIYLKSSLHISARSVIPITPSSRTTWNGMERRNPAAETTSSVLISHLLSIAVTDPPMRSRSHGSGTWRASKFPRRVQICCASESHFSMKGRGTILRCHTPVHLHLGPRTRRKVATLSSDLKADILAVAGSATKYLSEFSPTPKQKACAVSGWARNAVPNVIQKRNKLPWIQWILSTVGADTPYAFW